MDNYIMFEGKKIPLTEEQVKMLKDSEKPEEVKTSPFERQKYDDDYYFINATGDISREQEDGYHIDGDRFSVANYCADKKLMEQRALHETLNRLLWRFSMENGEGENPWNGVAQHYFIAIEPNNENEGFYSEWVIIFKSNCIYFSSKEVADRAIAEIVVPFMTKHPDFVW